MYELSLGPRSPPNLREEVAIPTGSNRGWLSDLNFVAVGNPRLISEGSTDQMIML